MLETNIEETELIRTFAEILRKVLPQSTPQKIPQHNPNLENLSKIEMLDIEEKPSRSAIAKQELPSMGEISVNYEAPKHRISCSGDAETIDDDDVRRIYEITSPYPSNMRFLD